MTIRHRRYLERTLILAFLAIVGSLFAVNGDEFGKHVGLWQPHGMCLLWNPTALGWMNAANVSIGVAYFVISWELTRLQIQLRALLPYHWFFTMFAAFIVLCGTTHFVDVLTVYVPAYWLAIDLDVLTALVSIGTAVGLYLYLPQIARAFVAYLRSHPEVMTEKGAS